MIRVMLPLIPLRLTAALALVCASALASQSVAQGSSILGDSAASRRTPSPLPGKPAAPPALPGAQSGGASLSARIPLDMGPTEAMFDGVNRGDIEAVRDALSRGAELNAHNILGITATELAIDLGRNDIAFLLLSMRGAEKPRRGQRPEPKQAAPKPVRPVAQPQATVTRRDPAPTRTYATNPGTPAPNMGFLGFDERSATR